MSAVHRFPCRVYFEDTDAGGIVYHANYLRYAERARTEMVSALGLSQNELLDGGQGHCFAVHRMEIDFVKAARLDDRLVVESTVIALGGASMDVEQVVRRVDDDAELVRLKIRLAFISLKGRAARIPPEWRNSLRTLVSERRI